MEMIKKGHLNFLMDGCAGSSGKGKMSSFIVKNEEVDYLVTSNSANASHTVVEDGKEFVFKVLPSASLHWKKLKKVFITSGSSFEVSALLKEIEMVGLPREMVKISPRAGIITRIDMDFESGLCDLDGNYYSVRGDGTIKTGTTASGSGSVLAKKTVRNKTLVVASMIPEIADMIADVDLEILNMHAKGMTGFFEIGQGYPLSNNHSTFAPYTTSRNVTVSSALNDAFLPPYLVGNVIINFRTYPIKIHSFKYIATEDYVYTHNFLEYGMSTNEFEKYIRDIHCPFHDIKKDGGIITVNVKKGSQLSWFEKDDVKHDAIKSYSGDFYHDQEEISWEMLNDRLENTPAEKIFECTTLTKLPRRIAEFSLVNLYDAIIHNHGGHKTFVTMNFANYVDKTLVDVKGEKDCVTDKFVAWSENNVQIVIDELKEEFGFDIKYALIGTGAETDSMIKLI